jgi:polyphosphate kinase 2 (PPK2 family)
MNVSKTLKKKAPRLKDEKFAKARMEPLKMLMLRFQQAAFVTGQRVVIIFEGFDAAGKGTCIRHLTESLDPRSHTVVPIGKPSERELGQHYLQRFWKKLPDKGHIVVFDRSWYGRVLVEKVEGYATPKRIKEAYSEINQFEKMLRNDGIILVKIVLVVSKKEQMARFKARLEDPFKSWKITDEDVRNRKRWDDYVKASDQMIENCPGWYVIASDDKPYARLKVLQAVTQELMELKKFIPHKKRTKRLDDLAKQLLASS